MHLLSKTGLSLPNSIGLIAIALWSLSGLLVVFTGSAPGIFVTALTSTLCVIFYLMKWFLSAHKNDDISFLEKLYVHPKTILIPIWGIGIYMCFYFTAFKFAPAIAVNLLNYLWPMLIILFGGIIYKNHGLGLLEIIGVILGFFGAALILLPEFSNIDAFDFNRNTLIGYGCAFTAAIIWALYSNITKDMKFDPDAMGHVYFYIAIAAWIGHFYFEKSYTPNVTEMLALLALSIVSLGYAFWDYAMKHGNIKLLASFSYAIPFLSTILIIIFTDQQDWSPILIGSIACILGGCVLVNLKDLLHLLKSKK